jgi:hypothetical protein
MSEDKKVKKAESKAVVTEVTPEVAVKEVAKEIVKDKELVVHHTAPEPSVPALTSEEKEHLKFLLQWVVEIGRKSSNVEFRRSGKAAVASLSKYL